MLKTNMDPSLVRKAIRFLKKSRRYHRLAILIKLSRKISKIQKVVSNSNWRVLKKTTWKEIKEIPKLLPATTSNSDISDRQNELKVNQLDRMKL
jgi:hypothetical protein